MKYLLCNMHELMIKKGYKTLSELSKATGISRSALTKIKNGQVDYFGKNTIISLCVVLECSVGELFYLADELPEKEKLIRQVRKENREGVVYFIRDPYKKITKIGRTKDINTRFENLRSEHKTDLKLILTIPTEDTVLLEKEIHKKFDDKRIAGEWFYITNSDIEGIKNEYVNAGW